MDDRDVPALDAFDVLPAEIIALILVECLPARWRFCARPVCRLWKAILDAAGDESKGRPRDKHRDRALSFDVSDPHWTKILRLVGKGGYHALLCRWRRGEIVLASTVAEWAHTRPDLWDHRPDVLASWCMACRGATPSSVVNTLVASARPPLVRYAIETLVPCGDRQADPMAAALPTCRLTDSRRLKLLSVATNETDLTTTMLIFSLVGPINWSRVSDITQFTEGDHADAFEFVLRVWAASNPCDESLRCLWSPLGNYGRARILARLLEIAAVADGRVGASDNVAGARDTIVGHAETEDRNLNGDDPWINTRPAQHHAPSDDDIVRFMNDNGQCSDPHIIDANDADAIPDKGDGGASSRSSDAAVMVPLSMRLACTWQSGGAKECLVDAAARGHASILALGRSILTGALADAVAKRACRSGSIETTRWCRANLGLPLTLREVAWAAASPWYDDDGYRASEDPAAFLGWVFDPQGAGYVPADDAEIVALLCRTAEKDVSCALWITSRWPRQIAAAGPTVLKTFVTYVCSHSTHFCHSYYVDGDTLERLVWALDLCARHAPAGADLAECCDMWYALLSIAIDRRSWGGCHSWMAVRYAWARVTGEDDEQATDALLGHGLCPAPRALWARWCRVRPIAASALCPPDTDSAYTKASNVAFVEWAHAKSLLLDEP
jgi:hypothetical protein